MATKLTHKIAIQLHLVVEMCTIWGSRCRKLLATSSYVILHAAAASSYGFILMEYDILQCVKLSSIVFPD